MDQWRRASLTRALLTHNTACASLSVKVLKVWYGHCPVSWDSMVSTVLRDRCLIFSCPNCITLLCSFRKILWITTKSSESAKSCWPWIEASSEKIPVFIIEATQETREVFSGWCPCINALQGWGILRRMWVWFLVKCGHGALVSLHLLYKHRMDFGLHSTG